VELFGGSKFRSLVPYQYHVVFSFVIFAATIIDEARGYKIRCHFLSRKAILSAEDMALCEEVEVALFGAEAVSETPSLINHDLSHSAHVRVS
jgi:hypothetical protein